MRTRALMAVPFLILAVTIAGCSSSGASSAPASAAAPSAAPSEASTGATVEAKEVGTIGKVLVAGSNGMTVYLFTKDVKDSGKSVCDGGCLEKWPALTVDAAGAATAGADVTGKLDTITRDDGALQVTYNGMPLYFFVKDTKPGDANGVYENWEAVKP